ncbi:MAG: sulfatase-like hydrolase/transferase [Oligosphaeraceae bacterium]|nr:sulfatase-like hydrolase/transferase [Oligosphaeraceae bacterium]
MCARPNILLLFTDMQRFDTIGALNNPLIQTPNLDRLAREGTAFTSAYSPCPVCVPARWCMHYGKYTRKSGLYTNGPMPADDGKSLPAVLGQVGYTTASVGKCHFLPDRQELRGFQSRLVQEECCSDPSRDDYCKFLVEHGLSCDEPQGTRSEMYYLPQVSPYSEEFHPSAWVGSKSLEFISKQQHESNPWFLFSSFIHPHPPCAVPKPWHKLYRAQLMPHAKVPANSEDLQCWINRQQNRGKHRDQGIDRNLQRTFKAYYYAAISFVDFQIGRILKTLEDSGQLENTLIVFTSDHGEFLGDYNCYGKRSMHDASCRVPMLIRYPQAFPAGEICRQPVSLVDLFPTLAAAAGADSTKLDLDGEELNGLCRGKSGREYVFSQFADAQRGIYMIVNEAWKYIYSAGDRREFLFDRIHDPEETCDKAGTPLLRDIQSQLKRTLLEYLKQENASEAYIETAQGLDWREYPLLDQSHLKNPDAGLGVQDHDALRFEHPGYTPGGRA